jgi:UDP-3-O-[3-hydroxymyristoyl] glucosamine N-acyltransferase
MIGNDVDIGTNTTIDPDALGDDVIEDYVKLDDEVQTGHKFHSDADRPMADCVGAAGSAIIGKYCTCGGGAMVLGRHLARNSRRIESSCS